MEDFEAIWERVMAREPDTAPEYSEDKALKEFIFGEEQAIKYYTALSCRASGNRALFKHIGFEERGHLKRLQTAHFLTTGDTLAPSPAAPIVPVCLLDAVRQAVIDEESASKAYRAASKRSDCDDDRRMFTQLAEDEAHHASELRALLESLL